MVLTHGASWSENGESSKGREVAAYWFSDGLTNTKKQDTQTRRKRRTVKKSTYLVHEGRHKYLKGPSPKPRRGDRAVPHRFAPFKLAEDDDEQEEEAV